MDQKQYKISDTESFVHLAYHRSEKDIFDIILYTVAGLGFLVAIYYLIVKGLLVEFSWI